MSSVDPLQALRDFGVAGEAFARGIKRNIETVFGRLDQPVREAPVDELIAWLRQQLEEDERVAREASRRGQDGSTLTGEHWHWIEPDYDEVLALDPMLDEYLNDGGRAELRSVEEYPSSVGPLPHFVLRDADVVHTVDAMHIARWDPKRVLDEVKAKRQILDDRGEAAQDAAKNHNEPGFLAYVDALDAVVHHLAQPYAGRDGWREEWRI